MLYEQAQPDRAIDRFARLRDAAADYAKAKGSIITGIEDEDRIKVRKRAIMKKLGASETQWNDYRWQLGNRFRNAGVIGDMLDLPEDEQRQIARVGERYRCAVSPYYLSLIDPERADCPIKKQSVPSLAELEERGETDPMDEEGWSPAECVTRRYPDRLIINVTNVCGMYCRFCQRRRLIGERDVHSSREKLAAAVGYVRNNREIRDVLLTGGDALLLSDDAIEWIVSELRKIPHVEIIRLGSRAPVTLPQRITARLAAMLSKYHPVYVNTHFNAPMEITRESAKACGMLADAGIPLGNQMVLLKGVNDSPFTVRRLNQALLTIRVKPYYIFHPKTVRGTSHFWVRIEEGLEIMESLRGRTSGLAIPAYIVNGPKGMGKTPILPNYLSYIGTGKAVFRNWEGKRFEIENPK